MVNVNECKGGDARCIITRRVITAQRQALRCRSGGRPSLCGHGCCKGESDIAGTGAAKYTISIRRRVASRFWSFGSVPSSSELARKKKTHSKPPRLSVLNEYLRIAKYFMPAGSPRHGTIAANKYRSSSRLIIPIIITGCSAPCMYVRNSAVKRLKTDFLAHTMSKKSTNKNENGQYYNYVCAV